MRHFAFMIIFVVSSVGVYFKMEIANELFYRDLNYPFSIDTGFEGTLAPEEHMASGEVILPLKSEEFVFIPDGHIESIDVPDEPGPEYLYFVKVAEFAVKVDEANKQLETSKEINENLKTQIEFLQEVIIKYDNDKQNNILGGWSGIFISGLVGYFISSMCVVPFRIISYYKNKPKRRYNATP